MCGQNAGFLNVKTHGPRNKNSWPIRSYCSKYYNVSFHVHISKISCVKRNVLKFEYYGISLKDSAKIVLNSPVLFSFWFVEFRLFVLVTGGFFVVVSVSLSVPVCLPPPTTICYSLSCFPPHPLDRPRRLYCSLILVQSRAQGVVLSHFTVLCSGRPSACIQSDTLTWRLERERRKMP